MERNDLMTPDHPRWNDFLEKLSRALICERTTRNARSVLTQLGGIDVDRSLETLRRLGGRCDCEIVFDLGHVRDERRRGCENGLTL